ncbi:MAG TPA: AzlD domain-containing protein [Actinomycetota bacterium]|nr:AzlD domain-containing protein [Actinomycetota bacterium]
MSRVWIVVLLAGAGTMALKAVGPVLLGGRQMPPRIARMLGLLAPAVLSALVVTETFGAGRQLVVDERLIGVAAGAVAVTLRAPLAVVLAIAAVATAVVRLLI